MQTVHTIMQNPLSAIAALALLLATKRIAGQTPTVPSYTRGEISKPYGGGRYETEVECIKEAPVFVESQKQGSAGKEDSERGHSSHEGENVADNATF